MKEEKPKVKYSGLVSEMAKHKDTQKSIAKLLDISEATISRRLTGETDWSIGEIEKLCNYYNKDYYELFVD